MTADLRLELRRILHEGHADIVRDVDQMQSLFQDVTTDLSGLLGALQQHLPVVITSDRMPRASVPDDAPRDALASDKAVLVRHLMMLMQFDDIASQILERARGRLALLDSFTAELLAASQDADPQRLLREQLDRHRARTRELLQRSVCQQSLEPGDVVLF